MAVELLNSTLITNQNSLPKIESNASYAAGVLKESVGYATPSATASIGSILRLCQVPSNARVSALKLTNGAVTSAAGDIGIYNNLGISSGSVVDVDYFGSAVSLASAAQDTNVINESTNNTIAKQQQMLWEALGLSSDPGVVYDIAITLTAAATASADVMLKASYAI